ncbi:hypothetical protein RF11_06447 [Thelohanellus kitauei]|uniref:Uncharacterized protein n=1 Tax=Thelohanellus kitauei TaxID=669202 RepID=A0A0C2N8J4_THEKT|nr:hypothetical protein RF11_06447 [Thelohanellus kitauei]
MKPEKLHRHLNTVHSDLATQPDEFQKTLHIRIELTLTAAAVDKREVVLGREFTSKLKAFLLSDNTPSRQIADMSEDVRCQLIAGLQHVKSTFQLNECTDISNAAQLLAYF